MLKLIIKSLCVLLLVSACTAEPIYRGVPEPAWQQLSAEQKQLIVDKAYQQEIQNS